MPIDLRSKMSGGGGSYLPLKYYPRQIIPSGASGDIATLSGVGGKRVRLEALTVGAGSSSSTGPETGISIFIDGVELVSGDLGGGSSDSGNFMVSQTGSMVQATNNSWSQASGNLSDVIGGEIVIKKQSGSTNFAITITYSEEK